MEDLAGKYSTDQGSAKMGGDLGYQDPSKYVPAFGAFCKQGKAGETNIVKTQYGYHIIRITGPMDYTKIKFVQNEIEISAGQKTVKVVDEKSRNFKNAVKGDFDKAVEKSGVVPRVLKDFTTDQKTIVGVDAAADSRSIIFWLFDKKRQMGDVSEVFAFSNKQVIVKVENIKNIGYATLDNVRSEIEPLVRSKMKSEKAAAKMADALKSNKSAEQLAAAVKGLVVSLDGVRFGQNFVPNMGQELQVLGASFGAKVKSTSK
jgi:parvulin-like peptidyl-prolyl isomerase